MYYNLVVIGLCCIPFMKEYWQEQEKQRYQEIIIQGDDDERSARENGTALCYQVTFSLRH
jgi:hypothetical protein